MGEYIRRRNGKVLNDGTMCFISGEYYVRQNMDGYYCVFDVQGIAPREPIEHDHMEEFLSLTKAKKYIEKCIKQDKRWAKK